MQKIFSHYWYEHGQVADNNKWPDTIKDGEVVNYELDYSFAGCVMYMGSTQVTIAFSYPIMGFRKLGVGTGHHGRDVWADMSDLNFKSFNIILLVADKNLLPMYRWCNKHLYSGNFSTVTIHN